MNMLKKIELTIPEKHSHIQRISRQKEDFRLIDHGNLKQAGTMFAVRIRANII